MVVDSIISVAQPTQVYLYLGQSFSWWSADQQMLPWSRILAHPCLREPEPNPQCPGRPPFLTHEDSFQSLQVLQVFG
jgi:hypothetical protein